MATHYNVNMNDVVILGGGPGGLAAALAFGRSRKRVLLLDAGPRRNAAHMHNFVTRDGTPPDEFRRIAREQLAAYPSVELRDVHVDAVDGRRGAFRVRAGGEVVEARRVLLATGMIDELPPIDGFRELWGRAIFQCPYCHGWEVRDKRWAYLARDLRHAVPFVLKLRSWTRDVVLLADDVPADARAQLAKAEVRIEAASVARLARRGDALEAIELANGTRIPCDVLFAHPPQRQTDLVRALGLELDEDGYVRVDPMKRETSIPGIYAAGDLTTRMQGATFAAAAGVQAAAAINVDLAMEAFA